MKRILCFTLTLVLLVLSLASCGKGNGSVPDSLTVVDGEIHYPRRGVRKGFVGLDSNHVLHVGKPTADDVKEWDIQYGASFGPVLIAI